MRSYASVRATTGTHDIIQAVAAVITASGGRGRWLYVVARMPRREVVGPVISRR
jgi:hypothetical protein